VDPLYWAISYWAYCCKHWEVVLGRWRRGREWKVLDGLRGEQESGLIGSVISFVGGVIGFESA
jgi:hypothetical protein